jgi:hypothetical protein
MAHVQIRIGDSGQPTLKVVIDGVDVSGHIYHEGLNLVLVGDEPAQEWGVSMIFAAESLDVDLPDAVLRAIALSVDEVAAR